MKYIIYIDDVRQFLGEKDSELLYVSQPYRAMKFDSPEDAWQIKQIYLPFDDITILGYGDFSL